MYGNYAPSWKANGTINACCFVVLDVTSPMSVIAAGSNGKCIGISGEYSKYPPGFGFSATTAAEAGDPIEVFTLGQVCTLILGTGGCTVDDFLISDANGNGVTLALGATHTTLQYCGAKALETGAVGEKVQVMVLTIPFIPSVS